MAKKFFSLPKWLQIVLLIIPVVGWVCEIVVRWSAVFEKKTVLNLVAALLYTFVGWGWVLEVVDIICILLVDHLFLTKA